MTSLALFCRAAPPPAVSLVLLGVLLAVACGGDTKVPVANNTNRGDPGDGDGAGGDGDSSSDGDAAVDDDGLTEVNYPIDFDPPDASVGTCDCGVHGECVLGDDNTLACECVKGYVASDPLGPCEEDLNCVELRGLECRSVWGGNTGAGNGILISSSYCSGRPFTEVLTEELIVEEKEGNNAFKVISPTESFARVIPRETKPHLYFAVDISSSIASTPENLPAIAEGIQGLLDRIEQFSDDFRVAVYLFDGSWYLYEYVPETTELDDVRVKLDKLHEQTGVDPSSSNVFGAISTVIDRIERSFRLKMLTSWMGALNTGTVVVISDGDDRARRVTQAAVEEKIDDTQVKVISIGLGDEAEFPILASLGRDGSFNADSPERLTEAFEAIADRLESFDQSLKFIGYCAGARAGTATVKVSLSGKPGAEVACTFNADNNQGGCGPDTLDPASDSGCFLPDGMPRQCGGLLACGLCPPGNCCSLGRCVAPSARTLGQPCATGRHCEYGLTCKEDMGDKTCQQETPVEDDMCEKDGVCISGVLACESLDLVEYWCEPARPVGWTCDRYEDCESLNCAPLPPATTGQRYCLPVARMFERCNNSAECEPGSYCKDNKCASQRLSGNSCGGDRECRSGFCLNGQCAYSSSCLFDFELDIGTEIHNLQP